ncbi:hypothetical protein [Streptomyces sp. NPDC058045]|uniref:hypothetical protein n=1 Tax=Streptomyces sp. NPDC058045 TaxID=3346311 RepID=UPI0036EB9CA8
MWRLPATQESSSPSHQAASDRAGRSHSVEPTASTPAGPTVVPRTPDGSSDWRPPTGPAA